MASLFTLPTDLSIAILRDWLGTAMDLAALDSASAESSRHTFLSLANHRHLIIQELKLNKEADMIGCVYWLNTRRVKFAALSVHSDKLKAAGKINYHLLKTVQTLKVHSKYGVDDDIDTASFQFLLKLLSSLTALDMGDLNKLAAVASTNTNIDQHVPTSDEYMSITSTTIAHLPLRHLHLDHGNTSCENIVPLVYAFRKTLQTLRLGNRSVDEDTLKLIATSCRAVRDFEVNCEQLPSAAMLAYLASPAYFPALHSLTIDDYYRGELNDDMIIAICKSHPQLTHFRDMHGIGITLTCYPSIFALCPDLLVFDSGVCQYEVKQEALTGERYAACVFQEENPERFHTEMPKVAASSRYPIREVSFIDSLEDSRIVTVVEAFGKDLWSFDVYMYEIVDETIQRLARTCSLLRNLRINAADNLSDQSLIAIADHCVHVNDFCLSSAPQVTNGGLYYLLQRMGPQLTALRLIACDQVSNATLLAIVAFCPKLTTLDIRFTAITAEGVLKHVVMPNQLLTLSNFRVGKDIFAAVKSSAVSGRWQTILDVDP